MLPIIDSTTIQNMIYIVRGHRVMLDSDLAVLYGVEVKRLNEQVKRNTERFPEDFMFQCNIDDLASLRSQIATANLESDWNYKFRTSPYVFTESCVAMLSSVLKVYEQLDRHEKIISPKIGVNRKKIGLK